MLKKLAMMRVRYDLEVHFFNSRREMARFIEEIYSAVIRNWKKDSPKSISTVGADSLVRLSETPDVTLSKDNVRE